MWYVVSTEVVPGRGGYPFINSWTIYAGDDVNAANEIADHKLQELEDRGCEILQMRDHGQYSGFDCLALFQTGAYSDRYYHLKMYFG